MSVHRIVLRGGLPVWLALAAAVPLAALFVFSLALAGVVLLGVGLVASLVLPLFLRRPARRDDGTIELDPSQYRRLPRGGDD
jgi:membrane protein implicated in regulation of membrane protease activity